MREEIAERQERHSRELENVRSEVQRDTQAQCAETHRFVWNCSTVKNLTHTVACMCTLQGGDGSSEERAISSTYPDTAAGTGYSSCRERLSSVRSQTQLGERAEQPEGEGDALTVLNSILPPPLSVHRSFFLRGGWLNCSRPAVYISERARRRPRDSSMTSSTPSHSLFNSFPLFLFLGTTS